jgi:hypothetical protein
MNLAYLFRLTGGHARKEYTRAALNAFTACGSLGSTLGQWCMYRQPRSRRKHPISVGIAKHPPPRLEDFGHLHRACFAPVRGNCFCCSCLGGRDRQLDRLFLDLAMSQIFILQFRALAVFRTLLEMFHVKHFCPIVAENLTSRRAARPSPLR